MRLLGLRVSNFRERRRDPGQLSLEQLLERCHQHHQQRQCEQGPGTAVGEQLEAELQVLSQVHTSQVLSAGEVVELTLRDWEQGGGPAGPDVDQGTGTAGSRTADELSLPPSLAVSPASARRYDLEAASVAAAAGSSNTQWGLQGAEFQGAARAQATHLLPTLLDRALQQAQQVQQGLPAAPGGTVEQEEVQQQQLEGQGQQGEREQEGGQGGQADLWACDACTFLNSPSHWACEVCMQPRRRAAVAGTSSAKAAGRGGGSSRGGRGRKRKSVQGAAPGRHQPITAFCVPAVRQPPRPAPDTAEPSAAGGAGPSADVAAAQEQQQSEQEQADVPPVAAAEERPESPLHPGEDVFECNICRRWVRETRLMEHKDRHMAERLQKEEERWRPLLNLQQRAVQAPQPAQRGRGGGGGGLALGSGRGQSTITALLKHREDGGQP